MTKMRASCAKQTARMKPRHARLATATAMNTPSSACNRKSRPNGTQAKGATPTWITHAQYSSTEHEGDLSSSLLYQLSDDELEKLASEYEYDRANANQEEHGLDDEDLEVELNYEGMTSSEAQEQSKALAVSIGEVLDDVKTQDIKIVHVGPHVSWCTYFVITSVYSRPQLDAALSRVTKTVLEKHDRKPLSDKRPGRSEWECIDFGDVVVHVMTPRQREKYDLEGYYRKAEVIDFGGPPK